MTALTTAPVFARIATRPSKEGVCQRSPVREVGAPGLGLFVAIMAEAVPLEKRRAKLL